MNNANGDAFAAEIAKQGEVVRDLKAKKGDKVIIQFTINVIENNSLTKYLKIYEWVFNIIYKYN